MIELNKIILGDCMELMEYIDDKSINLSIVDPPYGIVDFSQSDSIQQVMVKGWE